MKKILKIFTLICCILSINITGLDISASAIPQNRILAAAKPSTTTVKKAYLSYLEKHSDDFPYGQYKIIDINKDRVAELVVYYCAGVRGGVRVFTYKNGVKALHKNELLGVGRIYSVKNQKKICIATSNGASDSSLTYYSIQNNKLKKGNTIRILSNSSTMKYYYNKKRISEKKYRSYLKQLKVINCNAL